MTEPGRIIRERLLESVAKAHFDRFLAGADECYLERASLLQAAARLPQRTATMLLQLTECNPGNQRLRNMRHVL